MNHFSIFLLVVGALSITIGYLRKYKGLLVIRFDKEDKEDIYIKNRGIYDICYGALIIIAGILNEIYRPERFKFLIGLSLAIIIETIVFYVLTKIKQ